jgi:hypothetical protein
MALPAVDQDNGVLFISHVDIISLSTTKEFLKAPSSGTLIIIRLEKITEVN